MAKQTLPVDFQDDVLDSSMGGKRRWKLLLQEDGTYILEDVTNYDTVGSTFGASQVNQISQAVNQSADKGDVLGTLSQVKSNSDAKKIASANSLKELAVASNLKTYTTLAQLSLSTPVTVEQIFSAMPDNSYVQIDANNSNVVTNMPINSSGLLEISKIAGGRNFARFTESNTTNAANKTMWYGVFSWSGSVAFGGWKKILERDEILATDEEIEANTDPNKIASAVAVKRLNSETDTVANKIGNIDGITNQTYNSIGALLQYYINNGYLPDINSVPLIPKLTANNSQILTDSTNPNFPAWQAFDQSSSTFFLCEGTYVGYDFLKNVSVKKITWSGYNQGVFPGFGGSAKLQASDNKSSWIDVANIPGKGTGASSEEFNVPVAQSHRYWRVNNGANFGLYSLQFYGT